MITRVNLGFPTQYDILNDRVFDSTSGYVRKHHVA